MHNIKRFEEYSQILPGQMSHGQQRAVEATVLCTRAECTPCFQLCQDDCVELLPLRTLHTFPSREQRAAFGRGVRSNKKAIPGDRLVVLSKPEPVKEVFTEEVQATAL
ncbi:hypothetical protein PoB_005524300 [Plakobranchus ocellatus]|uniref:Uncharacterized protein n=1 Tax=Plakobranchus ocellatus TaxID=259542 RepID=A0AAV4CCN4_9GAST|nr:hypothetical protein PoB_005524300 [Plakobranchus ocellatus]